MRPFRAGESEYTQSVAIDASTIGGVTVTVSVDADRQDELDILDSIYAAAEDYSFYPFRDKSHNLNYVDHVDFFSEVIEANRDRLASTVHLGRDGSNPERVEAVQSAVLVNQLNPSNALVILDGNEDKAARFGKAMAGISNDLPPITTCIQSELYYPSSLLADLCASRLAYEIEEPWQCSEMTPEPSITKEDLNQYWGPAYDSMINLSGTIDIAPIRQYRAETVKTRIHCWFKGFMGGGEPFPTDRSVNGVANYVEGEGYPELAARLREI